MFSSNTVSSVYSQKNEDIYGVIVNADNLKVQVLSKGCTNQASFDLIWQGNNLTITRNQADNCRRVAYKKWITFTLPAHKKNFVLTNFLSATDLKNTFRQNINNVNKVK